MKKKRMTRNSFKRKVILFGIMAFMSIALVATGFAAWVIAGDSYKTTSGNVTIGTVTEKSLTVTLDSTEADIAFECQQADVKGRIRKSGSAQEALSFVVSGTVTDATFLDTLTVAISMPNSIKKAVGEEEGANKYITIPKATNELTYLGDGVSAFTGSEDGYYVVDNADGTKTAYFRFTVKFGWGEFFGGVNPGYWYDGVADSEDTPLVDDEGNPITTGVDKDLETILEEMNTFKNAVYVDQTYTDENGFTHTRKVAPSITVKVIATAG
ncbi:MAG: hypothetical protein IJX06_02860 [Clostridia bacterium]|nr:hypothetical protein [Clostridia bacterium]